jgi:hypothetical protein
LRRGIAEVEMHPDEIRVPRRDVSLRKIMQRLPSPLRNEKAKDGPPSLMVCGVPR